MGQAASGALAMRGLALAGVEHLFTSSGVPYLVNVLTDPSVPYPRGASSKA